MCNLFLNASCFLGEMGRKVISRVEMGEIDVGRFGNRGWYKIVIWENEVD